MTVADPLLGTVVGQYRLTDRLGEGGMGAVYRAEHTLIGRRAAVKVLLPELSRSTEMVTRFFNEARSAAQLDHAGIVDVYDFGTLPDGSAYLVMELLAGESLAARLHRGALPLDEACAIGRQIAAAVAAAHHKGIVHRDLKPDNVFLVDDPEVRFGRRVKVLDFGIAKLSGDGSPASLKTRTGAVMGTPAYMAPEQCRGAGLVDARADVYSLGCILYEMMCGRPPFSGEGVGELLAKHIYESPPPPRALVPALPPAHEALILRALAKRPEERQATMTDLAAELSRLGGDVAPGASGASLPHAALAPTLAATEKPITTLGSAAAESKPWVAPAATRRPARSKVWIPVVAAAAIGGGAIAAVALIAGKGTPAAQPPQAPQPQQAPPQALAEPPHPTPPPAQVEPPASATPATAARPEVSHERGYIPINSAQVQVDPGGSPGPRKVTIVAVIGLPGTGSRRQGSVLEEQLRQRKDVRVAWSFLPSPALPWPRPAALLACAAAQQGRFDAFTHALFDGESSPPWLGSVDTIDEQARAIGLDRDKYRGDVAGRCATALEAEQHQWSQLDVAATPVLFINGRRAEGERSAAELTALIDEEVQAADAELKKGVPLDDLYVTLTNGPRVALAPPPTSAAAPAPPGAVNVWDRSKGAGDAPARPAPKPTTPTGAAATGRAEVTGGIDPDIISRVARQHQAQVVRCYEKRLAAVPSLRGKVVVQLTIGPSGRVQSASITGSTLGDSEAESCIVNATRSWAFPQPEGGGIVTVSLPYNFVAR